MPTSERISWWNTSFDHGEAEAAANAIRSRRLGQGPIVRQFEEQLADYLGIQNVVAVSSGSDALLLTLLTLGVGTGDEVIVPKRSWIATAHAVHHCGATPIFVETTPDRLVMDSHHMRSQFTPRTRAILPVHVNGRSPDMDEINAFAATTGVHVIEDAAQALGSRDHQGRLLGTLSTVGCFSLSVAKVIGTGQGGFLATDDANLAEKLRKMRTHGVEDVNEPQEWSLPGFNFRLTDIAASIGLIQLALLPDRLERLSEIHQKYKSGLQSADSLRVLDQGPNEIGPYVEVLARDRIGLKLFLEERCIETRLFYPDQDAAAYWRSQQVLNLNRTAEEQGIYLPSGPTLTDEQIDYVTRAVLDFNDRHKT